MFSPHVRGRRIGDRSSDDTLQTCSVGMSLEGGAGREEASRPKAGLLHLPTHRLLSNARLVSTYADPGSVPMKRTAGVETGGEPLSA